MKKFIHLAQPYFGKEEKKEFSDALDSGWVTLGPRTKQFEDSFAKYTKAKYAVGVTSCTAALHLSLAAAGVGPGDEVITTISTFAATSNPIIHLGAKPVFVDIDYVTQNIDPQKIEEKITKRTKAIIPMHYGGIPCNMGEIKKIAKKNRLFIIEDAATAIGAKYKGKPIGSIGDLTCFSFHPIKNMSTGDGGMITTDNRKFAEKITMLRLHGMSKEAWKRHTKAGSWKYDIVFPGYKYNMSDIQASLGIHQLKKLENFILTRKRYSARYDKLFKNLELLEVPVIPNDVESAYNLYTIRLNLDKLKITRDSFIEKLKEKEIGASVYYIPLYEFSYYRKTFNISKKQFPVADSVFRESVSIPLYPKMTIDDIDYVAKSIIDILEKNRK